MTDKPFPCTKEGCTMTFANEDHLNVHRKKHDMGLNLGLVAKNNTVADQTPTPTRFIRNCEEVGLFQDLQNVNPFEETFKKALELSKLGALTVPEHGSDDTLHTPHILPHITETPNNNNSSGDGKTPNKKEYLIQKLRTNLKNREQAQTEVVKAPLPKKKPSFYDKNLSEVEKRREMNRMAQFRSRMKKKQMNEEFKRRMRELLDENNRLHVENQQLRLELEILRKAMLNHRSCVFEKPGGKAAAATGPIIIQTLVGSPVVAVEPTAERDGDKERKAAHSRKVILLRKKGKS